MRHLEIFRLGLIVSVTLFCAGSPAAAHAAGAATISGRAPAPGTQWTASQGETSLAFDPGMLESLEIRVHGSVADRTANRPGTHRLAISPLGQLKFWAPNAAFDGFAAGALQHIGELSLSYPGGEVSVSNFRLMPSGPDTLDLVDTSGVTLLKLDYLHTQLKPETREMALWNMDVSIAPALAERMGKPHLSGLVIGQAFTRTRMSMPAGVSTQGVCTSPSWHNGTTQLTDVELYSIGQVQQVARQAGVRVAVAPSASLRNVGTADVPWYPKFFTPSNGTYPAPYTRDQHPFLVWALYRESAGVLEQIGVSEVKHAFFAVNNACGCPGGNILWSANSAPNATGCTDVYGVGTNDDPNYLGPRGEVDAHAGMWEQCGSFFAPGATPPGPCSQTVSGATADEFERRLVVAESELQTADADYWMEAWYVIRDDVNLFNGLAHVTLAPTLEGSTWDFNHGTTVQGAALDEWVPPGTAGPMQAHVQAEDADGHYSVATRITDLGGGNYRYVYVVMNYDFTPRFDAFALAVPTGVNVDNFSFHDADGAGANDWTVSESGEQLTWSAPVSAPLDWGRMLTFVFRADAPPTEGDIALGIDQSAREVNVAVLSLVKDAVKRDGFEDNLP